MSIIRKLLEFFHFNNLIRVSDGVQCRSFYEFIAADRAEVKNIRLESEVLNLLVQKGLLRLMVQHKDPNQSQYYCGNFNVQDFTDAQLECMVYGFTSVLKHYRDSVIPIVVTTRPAGSGFAPQQDYAAKHQLGDFNDIEPGIGSGYVAGEHVLFTAHHCIDGMLDVQFHGLPENKVVSIQKHTSYDFVRITFENPLGRPPIAMTQGKVLDEVLVLGYPPLSRFDAVQVAEKASVVATLKAIVGDVVARDQDYHQNEYLLINNRIKGGNSGGPVLIDRGAVVGIVSEEALDPVDQARSLGYGVVVPVDVAVREMNEGRRVDLDFKYRDGKLVVRKHLP